MARVRKLERGRDGDAILSLSADRGYEGGELHVVGPGKRSYLTTHFEGRCVAFSGVKTLRALADAITRALTGGKGPRKQCLRQTKR
jgi:hypothetical protein